MRRIKFRTIRYKKPMVDERIVKLRLDEVVRNYGRERKYVIFPYGEYGKMAKAVLNFDFGIEEILIVDNGLYKEHPNLTNFDYLNRLEKKEDYLILICSCRSDIHEKMIEQLQQAVKQIEYVDVFEKEYIAELNGSCNSDYYELKKLIEDNSIKVQQKIKDLNLMNNYIYHPIKTKSIFFLPYVFMDCIQQEIFLNDEYKDNTILKWVFYEFENGIVHKYTKDCAAIDAGANIGNHTLYFLNETNINKVFSFEPVPQTYRILKTNIEINNCDDYVELFHCGLSDKECKMGVDGYVYENIGGTHLNNKGRCIDVITVDSVNFGEREVHFFKIDVEGMELKVLNGALSLIRQNRPVIMIESFDKYEKIDFLLRQMEYENISLGPNDYLFYPKEIVG